MSKIWFTSDLHLDHKNILKFQLNREFLSIADHNEHIMNIWKFIVAPEDTIFVLGDVCFSKKDYISDLPGNKVLIRGNHDHNVQGFDSVHDYLEIKHNGIFIVLFHYPITYWNKSHYGSWHLHGHTHGAFMGNGRIMDVGLDNHPCFRMFSFKEIQDHIGDACIVGAHV
jgi:calcineurin-like phosphoesterase family protein